MNLHPSRQFLIPALSALLATHAIAGSPPTISPKPTDQNPLSFFDGGLVFDVQERLRVEVRDNTRDFNSAVNDDNDGGWLLNRFRLGVTLKPATWLKVYAQGQDAREWFSERPKIPGVHSAEGDDAFDLRQGYVELADYKSFPLGLIVGRAPLLYGDRRLVGDSLWSNLGRTFDQERQRLQEEQLSVDAFIARPVQARRGNFDDSDAADNLAGVYLSTTSIPNQTTEVYAFYRDKSDNQPDLSPVNALDPNGTGNGPAERLVAIGARVESKPGKFRGWDYNAEFTYENGDVWASDRNSKKSQLEAFAAHAAGGYTFESSPWKPRLGLEYDYASGDRNPNDSKSTSFQNLFPGNHEKYGFMDEFSWRNLHDARFQFNVKPVHKLDLELDYHAFWLADTRDYWFRSNGLTAQRTVTPGGRDVRTIGANSFAGHEIDLTLNYEVSASFKVQAGYSHFFAGAYLRDTGADSDADFGYLMTTIQF